MKKLVLVAAGVFFGTFAISQEKSAQQAVPAEISEFVNANFTGQNIIQIDQEKEGFDVLLDDKTEIEFDTNYQVTEIDTEAGIPGNLIPASVSALVAEKYPNGIITDWELIAGGHEIELNDGTKLKFNNQGELIM